jgi:hypothetical protein
MSRREVSGAIGFSKVINSGGGVVLEDSSKTSVNNFLT